MTTTPKLADSGAAYWSLYDLAAYLGVTYNSARTYHGRSEINRRHGADPVLSCKLCKSGEHYPKTGDLPPPDRKFGRSPVWKPTTIESWRPRRPGRGAGGGRRKAPGRVAMEIAFQEAATRS